MKGKKVLVTGAFGLLGRSVVKQLVGMEADVTAVYHKNKSANGVTQVQCDLTDSDKVKKMVRPGFDYIIHLAGQPAVWYSNKQPLEDFKKNVLTTMNLLDAIKDRSCIFVYSSTCSLYPEGTSTEDTEVNLNSFYDKNKYHSEQYIEEYTRRYSVNGKIVRFSFVYGPGVQRGPVYDAVTNEQIRLFVSQDSEIDFIYTDDAALGLLFVAEHGKEEVYNISSGIGVKIGKLMKLMEQEQGKRLVSYSEKKQVVILDNTKVQKLGWKPQVTLKEGLKKTIKAFNKHI